MRLAYRHMPFKSKLLIPALVPIALIYFLVVLVVMVLFVLVEPGICWVERKLRGGHDFLLEVGDWALDRNKGDWPSKKKEKESNG